MSKKKKNRKHKQYYTDRKQNTKKPLLKHSTVRNILWIAIIVAMCALALLVSFMLSIREGTAKPLPKETTPPTEANRIEDSEEVTMNLGHGLLITDVGSYTGMYMEDGSDEIVSGILMIQITNTGEEDIEYAQISLACGDQTAQFRLSTLPAGETAILLEQNRMQYDPEERYAAAVAENVAVFRQELSICDDRIQLQVLNGALNVKNISEEDIDGDIVIYYKNYSSGIYYGGITYMIRIQGGLKAGEIRQSVAAHISPSASRVMFVTCGD